MTTEITPAGETAIKTHEDIDIEATATTGDSMAEQQRALIDWCARKVATLRLEAKELRQAFEEAQSRKWKSTVLERHWKLTEKRIVFYGKIWSALKQGYLIVPSFPCDVFAVRRKGKPTKMAFTQRDAGWTSNDLKQSAEMLPEGDGQYRNPFPLITSWIDSEYRDENQKNHVDWKFIANAWDQFEFPVVMAKAKIIEATDDAMKLKIFDDFGIVGASVKASRSTQDPMIIARITDPRGPNWNHKTVNFLIAWHLDTKTL